MNSDGAKNEQEGGSTMDGGGAKKTSSKVPAPLKMAVLKTSRRVEAKWTVAVLKNDQEGGSTVTDGGAKIKGRKLTAPKMVAVL